VFDQPADELQRNVFERNGRALCDLEHELLGAELDAGWPAAAAEGVACSRGAA